MKQLTKEQHEAIYKWLQGWEQLHNTAIPIRFKEEFIAACCDSCADGEECETDKKEERDRKEWLESKESHYPKAVFTEPEPEWQKKQVSIDRHPEETTSEYMDRVATINGRK